MQYLTDHLPDEGQVLKTDTQRLAFYNFYSQTKENGTSESWLDACKRATDALRKLSENKFSNKEYQEIFEAIYLQNVLPSMRLFSMPWAAIERCNSVIYNCSFIGIDNLSVFGELMYLTMSGVGCGYSVEKQYINDLPKVPHFIGGRQLNHIVKDSQIGWAESVQFLIDCVFYDQLEPLFDYRYIREEGARLKTKGGIASGYKPLQQYHRHLLDILRKRQGKPLTALDVHDMVNMVSECATSNGSRSGALICLFDDDEQEMFNAKSDPKWYEKTPWRSYSNNSVVVDSETPTTVVDDIVERLLVDKVGDPGMFSTDKFFQQGRTTQKGVGVNPCGEVLLRSTGQFCNLSTVVLSKDSANDLELLRKHARIATLIGTIQSSATHFRYLRKVWSDNSEDERLLGVCVTGIYDYKEKFSKQFLKGLKDSIETYNKVYSETLGINRSTCTTSVKPSGNTSLLTNTSPGINPDFAPYYVRNINIGKHSKLAKFLKSQGYEGIPNPFELNSSKTLFTFPKESVCPENTIPNTTAKEQLDNYRRWADNYTTHNVSVTITYKEDEQEFLAKWIEENHKSVTGMAFFPETLSNMPYTPIEIVDKEAFDKTVQETSQINWDEFYQFTGKHEQKLSVECSGDRCDIVYEL